MVTQAMRPSYAGVYPILDAVHFIRATTPQDTTGIDLTTQHLFRWVREGLSGEYLHGLRGNEIALTFLDLITMRMVAAFRSHGLSPKEIKTANDNLKQQFGWTHPFAMEPVWHLGPEIVIIKHDIPIAIARWQPAFSFVRDYLVPIHGVCFDEGKEATAWEPTQGILLDPKMAFGSPCIRGTRVSTETIWALHEAGDPVGRIADAYGLEPNQVESAIAWESKLEQYVA